jgi:hypothetical protein
MTSGQAVRPPPAVVPASPPSPWLLRRLFPILATVALIVIGMVGTTLVGPHLVGRDRWSLPDDLWGTLIAADRLVHLNLAGLYTQPTGLVTFPGAAVILAPVATLIDAAGLSLQHPGPHNPHPAAWLAAGPYMIAICGVALFAADALAERLGVTRRTRFFLAGASAVALWNVSVQWGHPEDAVAVGLLLYGILALSRARTARAAWLLGAAIAVQPLVLLALPILLAVIEPRRIPGFLARAATPPAALLGAAAVANWHATYLAVAHQPNWPIVDHPTPWTPLAPHMAGGAVADGPFRLLAILGACGCAPIVARRLRGARQPGRRTVDWSEETLSEVLWWAALALAVRCAFEPVMVAYYLWPALAVALITATRTWPRLLATSVMAAAVTFGSQSSWRSPWGWWGAMVVGLALTLVFSVPSRWHVFNYVRVTPRA